MKRSPALFGATRVRSAPNIGLGWHRPWAALNGKSSKRGALFFASLALSACAPRPAATIYCITPEQVQKLKSAEPERVGDKLTGQAQDDLKTIAGSAVRLRAWGEGLIGVLEGCQEPPR